MGEDSIPSGFHYPNHTFCCMVYRIREEILCLLTRVMGSDDPTFLMSVHNRMYHYKKFCKGATVQYTTILLSLGSDDPTYNPSCSNSISGKAECGYP